LHDPHVVGCLAGGDTARMRKHYTAAQRGELTSLVASGGPHHGEQRLSWGCPNPQRTTGSGCPDRERAPLR